MPHSLNFSPTIPIQIANMTASSKSLVNYVRVKIDEVDESTRSDIRKVTTIFHQNLTSESLLICLCSNRSSLFCCIFHLPFLKNHATQQFSFMDGITIFWTLSILEEEMFPLNGCH